MLRLLRMTMFAAGVLLCLHADQMPLTYYYTFTLPTFQNGSPDGGTFTTTIAFSPGPLENTTIPSEQPGFVPPMQQLVDVSQSPKPGMTLTNAPYGNADIRGYTLLGNRYFAENQGAWLELDYSGPSGSIDFGFAATDGFWKGPGGVFGDDPTLSGLVDSSSFAAYLTSGDPLCTTCSVSITSAPEPASIMLILTISAALTPSQLRRRRA